MLLGRRCFGWQRFYPAPCGGAKALAGPPHFPPNTPRRAPQQHTCTYAHMYTCTHAHSLPILARAVPEAFHEHTRPCARPLLFASRSPLLAYQRRLAVCRSGFSFQGSTSDDSTPRGRIATVAQAPKLILGAAALALPDARVHSFRDVVHLVRKKTCRLITAGGCSR